MQKVHNFFWESSRPEFTLKDSFLIGKVVLMAYRIFCMLAMIAIYIWISDASILPFKYLTNWGVTFVLAYFVCISLCYVIYFKEESIDVSKPFAFWKFVVLLGEFAFSLQVLIPPYYWLLLYPPDDSTHHGTAFWRTICAHAVTGLLIWVETFFNHLVFRKRHLIIVLLLGMVYALINCIYTKIDGPVYPNLTWDDISTLYLIVGSLTVVCLGFWMGLLFSRLKLRMKKRSALVRDNYLKI